MRSSNCGGTRALAAGVAFATALPISITAFAEQSGSDNHSRLEEVVVSATRRESSSQEVPISISVLSASQMQDLKIDDVRALTQVVPGFQANRVGPFPLYFIRGVGSTGSAPTIEPAVATYVDDVYIPSSAAAAVLSYSNLDRVEVLKGPQGTLFGRNSTAGVVQIFTRNPERESKFEGQLGYGNYNTTTGSVYANVPLGENWAVNLSADGRNQKDGWGYNETRNEEIGLGWDYNVRVKLLGELTDNVTAKVTARAGRLRSDLGGFQRVAPGTRTVYGFSSPTSMFRVNTNDDIYVTQEGAAVSLKLDANLDRVRLVSISAYQEMNGLNRVDLDLGPTFINYTAQYLEEQTLTQEFQVLSSESSKLQWILGAFYYDDQGGNQPRIMTGSSVPAGLYSLTSWVDQATKSWAGYGELSIEVIDGLKVTAGLRYTHDDREYESRASLATSPTSPLNYAPVPGSPASITWSKTTGRLGLNYKISPDVMIYAMGSTGFRSGSYNMNPGFTAAVGAPVNPETVIAYTAGVKSEFFDGRARVNVEAFHNTYEDLQLQQTNLSGTFTVNAAEAVLKGVDIEVAGQITDRFSMNANVALLDGEYSSYPNGIFNVYRPASGGNCTFTVVPGGPAPCGGLALPPNYNAATGTWDLKGNDTVQSPPLSYTLGARYEQQVAGGDFEINTSVFYSDRFFFDADNGLGQVAPSSQNYDRQEELYLLRGSVAWTTPRGAWTVRLWGDNLTNETYKVHASLNALGIRNMPAAPRTYGINFEFRP